jgi:hypothetical protein
LHEKLKIEKNTDGIDRIPQKILVDGVDILSILKDKLMNLIYSERKVPEQWLVFKIIPVFKNKGQTKDIKNYKSMANQCSSSNFC